MAFDKILANRMRKVLRRQPGLVAKQMFGGIAFMVGGKMACGVIKNDFVARVDKAASPALRKRPHVRPMTFTGKPMAGFLYVGPGAVKTPAALKSWISRCVEYARSLPPAKRRARRPRPFPRRTTPRR